MKRISLLSLISLVITFTVIGQVPQTMHFQGFLADPGTGDAVTDGDYSIIFTIYDNVSVGSSLWTETHSTVAVADGYFSVILGSEGAPLDIAFDIPYFLEVGVGGETLSPRYTLSSSSYAFKAQSVEGITIDNNGYVGIGTETPAVNLSISGEGGNTSLHVNNYADSGRPRIALVKQRGTIDVPESVVAGDQIGRLDFSSYNGTAVSAAVRIAVESVDPANHSGKLIISTKDNTGTENENFTIDEDGFVGIGTVSPSEALEVAGNVRVNDKLGIGTTSSIDPNSAGIDLRVQNGHAVIISPNNGFSRSADGTNLPTLMLQSTRNNGDGAGASIGFEGKYTDGGSTIELGHIRVDKANSTSPNSSGLMKFYVRDNSGGLGERMRISNTGNVTATGSFSGGGLDFAEYFENEEQMISGDIVGINLETGRVRKYHVGDEFVGIVSSDPSFVGGLKLGEEASDDQTLVGLTGQLEFNKDQVIIENRIVKTLDRKKIGVLLSTGRVFIR